jgi:hypothetical protein
MPLAMMRFLIVQQYQKELTRAMEKQNKENFQAMTVEEYVAKAKEAFQNCGCEECKAKLKVIDNVLKIKEEANLTDGSVDKPICKICGRVIYDLEKGCPGCNKIGE